MEEERSVLSNAWNKIVNFLKINPYNLAVDAYNYTRDYFSDDKKIDGVRTSVPKSQEEKDSRSFGDYMLGLAKHKLDNTVDLISDGLSFFNFISPSLYIGMMQDAKQNGWNWRRASNLMLNGNHGIRLNQPLYVESHPYSTMAENMLVDVGPGLVKGIIKGGLGLVDDFTRNMRPPMATSAGTVGVEAIPAVNFNPQISTNPIQIIPTVNLELNHYQANSNDRIKVTRLDRSQAPTAGNKFYPNMVTFDDGFANMIREMAKERGINLDNLDLIHMYSMPKPKYLNSPSQKPTLFNGLATTFWRKNKLNVGDLGYGLSFNLSGYKPKFYKDILIDTGRWDYDYIAHGRAFMYDLKAQAYYKIADKLGHNPTYEEFIDELYDLSPKEFGEMMKQVHDGMYIRDIPTKYDFDHLTLDNVNEIIDILKEYKHGGKLIPKSTKRFN